MKQIVIVEPALTEIMAKIAFTLKKRGYETVLINLMGNAVRAYKYSK